MIDLQARLRVPHGSMDAMQLGVCSGWLSPSTTSGAVALSFSSICWHCFMCWWQWFWCFIWLWMSTLLEWEALRVCHWSWLFWLTLTHILEWAGCHSSLSLCKFIVQMTHWSYLSSEIVWQAVFLADIQFRLSNRVHNSLAATSLMVLEDLVQCLGGGRWSVELSSCSIMHFRYTHFSTALPWNTYTRVGEFMTISQLVVSPHTKQSKKDAIRSGIVHVSRTDVCTKEGMLMGNLEQRRNGGLVQDLRKE